MKLAILGRGLFASLLLLGISFPAFAQDEAASPQTAGYEKIEMPAEFAMLPKPAPPEDDSKSSQQKHTKDVKEWQTAERARRAAREEKRKLSEAAVRAGGGGPMRGYFNVIHFPLMTTNFSNTTRDRKYVRDELAEASPAARAELLTIVTDWCKKFIEGNYPPGTRVNAALLLGELNDVEAKSPTPATPNRAASKYLLALLDNQAIPPEVKSAALVGILRHVELDAIAAAGQKMPPADMDAIVTKMIALASAKDPPPEIAKPIFIFMQRRAATILGAYGQPGADGKVYNALVAVVGNDAAPLWVRCDAAMSLGRLNYPAEVKLDAVKGAKSLGALAAFAANDELETLKKANEGGGAIGGPGGLGGPGGVGGPGGYGGGGYGGGGRGFGAPPGGGKVGGPGGMGPPGGGRGGPPGSGGGGLGSPGEGLGGGVPGGGMPGGGSAGGNSVYYADHLVDAMVRRLMAAFNSALIGLDGANGKGSGLRKPKQDAALDRIAESIEKLRAQLVRLQKKDAAQETVFRDLRLAILDMETAAGVKKKSAGDPAAKPAETAPPSGGTTGGQ